MCSVGEGGCGLDRRDFVKAGVASVAGLPALGDVGVVPQNEPPPTRVLDAPGIEHGNVMFRHAGKETFDGYLARPKADGVFPGVVVLPGNVITEEYIPNTCATLALAGFVGLTPNIFHPLPSNDTPIEERGKYLKDHSIDDVLEDIQVAFDYLRTQPFVRNSGFGALGFCWGGWLSLLSAARFRDIRAVVAFHPGIVRDRDELSQVQVPVQLHQGTADTSIEPKTAIQIRDALTARHVPVELFMYEGADHGFTAYTREFYRPDFARLSLSRATKFLSTYLNEK